LTQESAKYDLTTNQVAQALGITERSVRRKAKSGQLSYIKIRGKRGLELRFSSEEVGQLISKQEIQGGQSLDLTYDPTQTQAYRDLLLRHEQALYRIGLLEGERNRLKELESGRVEEIEKLRSEIGELKSELEKARMSWWKRLRLWLEKRQA